MSYKLLISSSIVIYLSSIMPTLIINKFNNMSSFFFIIKAKQKNVLINKI
jgi:hypothetical protein